MSTCENETTRTALELPDEFEDLAGLLHADLQAVVNMLTQRAHERLLLTRREHLDLQHTLWDRLAEAINGSVACLSAECR